jgi:stage II sporulation protein D
VTRSYPGALRVTVRRGALSLVNEAPFERYVEGVLAGECPALFHREAIRAMAIACRSYAFRRAFRNGAELCDEEHCQVYAGVGGVRSSIREAVRDTEGLCALYQGEVIDAVHSADCGGWTEDSEAAWKSGRAVPYLRAVEDAPAPGGPSYCGVNRRHAWSLELPRARLQALLGKPAPEVTLQILEMTPSGRARRLRLGPPAAEEGCVDPARCRVFDGEEWRRAVGPAEVRSLRFRVRRMEKGVELRGEGYGHGVGLCQFGAQGMARGGADAAAILRHYYAGIDIGRADRERPPGRG